MREGIQILSQIREQWSKLVMFFSAISTKATVTLNAAVKPFLEYTEQFQTLDSIEPEDRSFYLDLLMDEAKEIQEVSFFLHMVAETYVQISQEYIIPPLAGLPAILSAADDATRTRMVEKLQHDSKQAMEYIESLGKQQQSTYQKSLKAKIKEVTENLQHYEGGLIV